MPLRVSENSIVRAFSSFYQSHGSRLWDAVWLSILLHWGCFLSFPLCLPLPVPSQLSRSGCSGSSTPLGTGWGLSSFLDCTQNSQRSLKTPLPLDCRQGRTECLCVFSKNKSCHLHCCSCTHKMMAYRMEASVVFHTGKQWWSWEGRGGEGVNGGSEWTSQAAQNEGLLYFSLSG